MSDEEAWDRLIDRSVFRSLSTSDLRNALHGYGIPDDQLPCLLRDIQKAMIMSEVPVDAGNLALRKDLLLTAKALKRAQIRISGLGEPAWAHVNHAARRNSDGSGARSLGGIAPAVFPDFDRLQKVADELAWAEDFVANVAALVPRQMPRWRERTSRNRFINLASQLTPIYESLTGSRATVDNWPESKSLGPWPEFYIQTVRFALGVAKVRDLKGVLLEASRQQADIRRSKQS